MTNLFPCFDDDAIKYVEHIFSLGKDFTIYNPHDPNPRPYVVKTIEEYRDAHLKRFLKKI